MVEPRQGMLASRVLVRGSIWALGAALGLVLGCLDLQRGFSCGDGWWDPEFEDCDPRDPESPHLDPCVRCDDSCRLDYSACEPICGDGILLGDEECEIGVDGGFKNLACSDYKSTAIGMDKPYASGMIGSCNKDTCTFGRNDCSFCGDGELDRKYDDIVAPQGTSEFPVELCDGDEVEPAVLEDHCEALCVDDAINGDVVVNCDFECADDCLGIAPPDDIIPAPAALGCCVAKDSPCPKFGIEGVPNLPCCSWLERPEWLAVQKCVPKETKPFPEQISYICP